MKPGDDVTMTVLTAPNSLVATLVVDKKVLLLKSGNDITESQVLNRCHYLYNKNFFSLIFSTNDGLTYDTFFYTETPKHNLHISPCSAIRLILFRSFQVTSSISRFQCGYLSTVTDAEQAFRVSKHRV